jgi:hypothetical protein
MSHEVCVSRSVNENSVQWDGRSKVAGGLLRRKSPCPHLGPHKTPSHAKQIIPPVIAEMRAETAVTDVPRHKN